jgi:hypothetical protein
MLVNGSDGCDMSCDEGQNVKMVSECKVEKASTDLEVEEVVRLIVLSKQR